MFELFKLIGRVMVDNSGANQALDETNGKAEKTTSEIGQYADKLKNWAAGLLTVSSVVAGLKKVWEVSAQVAELGDSIDKNSKKFLLSTQAYQKWMYIGEHYSFTIEQVGNAVVDLSKKVGSGSEDVLAMLEEIGISAADAMTSTPEELFEMVVSGLQNMEDSTRKAYIADGLLGGAAKDLGAFLESNAEDAQALEKRMDELGGTMSDSLIGKSAEYQDSVTDLKYAWQGVKNDLAEETVPAMTEILNGLTQMLTGDFVEGLETAADGVADYLGAVAESVGNWAENIRQTLEDKLGVNLSPIVDSPLFNPFSASPAAQQQRQAQQDAQLAFDDAMQYAKLGREGTIGDFFTGLWDNLVSGEGFKALAGKASAPSMDVLQGAYSYFLQQGGTQSDFLDQLRANYGADIQAQFEEYLQSQKAAVDTATETYTTAVDGAAQAWNQSAADVSAASSNAVDAMNAAADKIYSGRSVYGNAAGGLYGGFSHASGLEFVPRDDYPARLHYGERVLTRQENEEYNAGRSGGNNTINIQTVAQSPAQTAAAITAALARARWAM